MRQKRNIWIYERIVKPLLFQLDPEFVHGLTLKILGFTGGFDLSRSLIKRMFFEDNKKNQSVEVFGLKFSNPVGLAAGYDKDGIALRGLDALGFSHIEIGTVTPLPQYGNPKKRVFRIPQEGALINRMGFPGQGMEIIRSRLEKIKSSKSNTIFGVNIGRNKDTLNEDASRDYLQLFNSFYNIADYLVVNISSPNTLGLRRLQARGRIESLLMDLNKTRKGLNSRIPILVKISPDLEEAELDDVIEAIITTEMDGIVAVNTTINHENLKSPLKIEVGGLSGSPLTSTSKRIVAYIYSKTKGQLPIIGVGGIMTPDQAKAMLDAGASLIQIYTGLIYSGPSFVKMILQFLVQNE